MPAYDQSIVHTNRPTITYATEPSSPGKEVTTAVVAITLSVEHETFQDKHPEAHEELTRELREFLARSIGHKACRFSIDILSPFKGNT